MKTINSISEYSDLKRKLDANTNASLDWCKQNKTNGIPKEVYSKFPFADEIDNDSRSAIEEYEFKIKPPDKYFCYVSEKNNTITTWTGQKLGNIISWGREFKSSFGDKRQYIKIKAINGLLYGGFYFKSSGDYATIKKLKLN